MVDESRAREILGEWIQPDGSLRDDGMWLQWKPGANKLTFEGYLTIDHLKALVWWIENHPKTTGA
jgi:hypothetical protein